MTSIKSLMARYEQMRERGFAEEDGTKVNQVAKSLNEVGITIMDNEGNFRNFATVMDELGAKWQTLDNRHKAYISTTLAGTHQQAKFLNLMESYSDSVRLYDGALESAGATQQKYNLWMEGTEAHINQLKATAEGLWIKVFDSEAIRNGIDIIEKSVSALDSLVNKIGAVPSVFVLALSALSIFKKEYSAFYMDLSQWDVSKKFKENFSNIWNMDNNKGKGGFGVTLVSGITSNIKKLVESYRVLNNETIAWKLNADGSVPTGIKLGNAIKALGSSSLFASIQVGLLRIGMLALNAVIGWGLGIVVSKAMEWLTKLINGNREAKNAVDELLTSYKSAVQNNNNNIQTLMGMGDEYERLSGKVSLTSEEQNKLNDMTRQIAEISPDVVQGYDSQGNAVLRLQNGIKGLVEELKQKNENENLKLINDGGTTALKNYIGSYKDLQKQIEKVNEKLATYNQKKKESEANYARTGDKSYLTLNKQYDNAIEESTKTLKLYQSQLVDTHDKLSPFIQAILNTNSSFQNLDPTIKTLIQDQTRLMDLTKYNKFSELEMGIKSLVSNLNSPEIKNGFDKVKDLQKQLADKSISKDSFISSATGQLFELSNTINKLNPELKMTPELLAEIAKVDLTPVAKQTKDLADFAKEASSNLDDVSPTIENINKVLEQHAKTGEWDVKVLLKLAEIYPELLQYLDDDAKLTSFLTGEKSKLSSSVVAGVKAEMTAIEGLLSGYGVEVKGKASAEEAKNAITKSAVQKRIQMYNAELHAVESIMGQIAQSAFQGTGEEASYNAKLYTMMNRQRTYINASLSEINSIGTTIDKYFDLKALMNSVESTVGKIGLSDYDGKKNGGSSGSGSKESTTYESKLDGADKFTARLEDMNSALKKQDDLLANIQDKIAFYKSIGTEESLTNAVKEQNNLYTEQTRKLAYLKSALQDMQNTQAVIGQSFKNNWGIDVTNWSKSDFTNKFESLFPTKTFTSQSQQEAYEQAKKTFNQLTDDWFKFQDSITSTSNDIITQQNTVTETIRNSYELYFSSIETSQKKYVDSISETQNQLDLLNEDESFNTKEELTQKLIANTKAYRDSINDTVNSLKEQLKGVSSESVQWTIINDKINEYNGLLQGTNKELKDAQDKLKEITNQEYQVASTLEDKIVDTLRTKYEKAKQKELDDLSTQKETDIKNKNDELDRLRAELESLQDDSKDKQDNLNTLKEQLELWKKDNSAYAKGKVKDLEKQIKDKEKELAIDEKEKEIKNKEDELKTIEDNASAEEKRIEDKYKVLLEEQNLYDEATKLMATSTQDEILALLLTYDDKYKGLGETLGKAYSDALLAEIKAGIEAMKSLQDGVSAPTLPTVTPSTPPPPVLNDGGGTVVTTPTPPPVTVTPPPSSTPPASSSGDIPWDGRYYQYGSKGGSVSRIQQNLNALGYGLAVDGIFGSKTKNAVLNFQRKNGLSADGIIGRNTWSKLIKFSSGGYTGDWLGDDGKIAILHQKERILNANQTKAFDHFIYNIMPKFLNDKINNQDGLNNFKNQFNAPVVKNDIVINNKSEWDMDNNFDNLNRAIKNELRVAGLKLNLT